MKHKYIAQYSKKERFVFYKVIKERLLSFDSFNIENLTSALNEKTDSLIESLFATNNPFEIAYSNTKLYNQFFNEIL